MILLVDDEPMLLAMIALALRLEGIAVLTAGSGAEAISISELRPSIDLLITEVDLPGIGGPVLAARLLAKNPYMPVLFISGDAEAMPLAEDPQIEFLAKPFALKTFVADVQRLLRMQAVPAIN
jgi:two-component system cell cycle sensor histidine kinase/response regulator CckA